jgi:hypothetical protein
VFIGIDRRRVVAVFPERPVSILALVVFLRCSPGDELHALCDDIPACVFHEEVDVVGCHHVVKHAQTVPRLRFKEPVQITAPIAREL